MIWGVFPLFLEGHPNIYASWFEATLLAPYLEVTKGTITSSGHVLTIPSQKGSRNSQNGQVARWFGSGDLPEPTGQEEEAKKNIPKGGRVGTNWETPTEQNGGLWTYELYRSSKIL